MNFQYNYNLHGSDRKPLVEAISQILEKPAVYQGAPSFSYIIGDYTVDRNGVLSYGSNIHPDFAVVLIRDLQERGFVAENVTTEDATAEETVTEESDTGESATDENIVTESTISETGLEESEAEEPVTDAETTGEATISGTEAEENAVSETAETVTANTSETASDSDAPTTFTVEVPDTGFTPETRENLKKIVASKATLLRQALRTDDLSIVELDGKIAFPWFTLHGLEGEADAYSRLITAICNMAKNQKRVTAMEKPEENAKYAMRLFLVRLGFIGDEYKTARKILPRNLTGNSSWKSGHKPERTATENAAIPPDPSSANLPTAQELAEPLGDVPETAENEAAAAEDVQPATLQKENEGGEPYGK